LLTQDLIFNKITLSKQQTLVKRGVEVEKYATQNCGDIVILKYADCRNVLVKFINTGYETVTTMSQIRKGTVKDKTLPSVYDVGIVGNDLVITDTGDLPKEYRLWEDMLRRCYSSKFLQKHTTYKGCNVSYNFKYFQNFKVWCNDQIGFKYLDDKGLPFQLDKDILVKGNKQYSEETCCFVPQEVNSLFVKRDNVRGDYPVGVYYDKARRKFAAGYTIKGVRKGLGRFTTPEEAFYAYKQAKEAHIKEVANKWKDYIDPRVYETLMNYEVEITD